MSDYITDIKKYTAEVDETAVLLGFAGEGGGALGLASMLDLNGDGNPLDDILRVVGKAMG